MKRSKAADLIDDARRLASIPGQGTLLALLAKHGLEPLTRCPGEAHSNPHIDHCGLCAPRWGWVGKKEPVT